MSQKFNGKGGGEPAPLTFEMKAYDNLPPDMRKLIRNFPENLAAWKIGQDLHYWRLRFQSEVEEFRPYMTKEP